MTCGIRRAILRDLQIGHLPPEGLDGPRAALGVHGARPMRHLLAAVLVLPSLARADVDVDIDIQVTPTDPPVVTAPEEPAEPPAGPILRGSRWELGVFLEGGRISLGGVAGGQLGVRGEVARQLGPLRLGLEGSLAKFSAQVDLYDSEGWWTGWEDLGGEVSRVGVTARLRLGTFTELSPTMPYRVDVGAYLEGGLGSQHLAMDSGASLDRSDVVLGVGFEIAGGRHRIGGFDAGVRAVISPSMDPAVQTHEVSVLVGLGGRVGL